LIFESRTDQPTHTRKGSSVIKAIRTRSGPSSGRGKAFQRLAAIAGVSAIAALMTGAPAYAADAAITPSSGGTTMSATNAGPSATYTSMGNIVIDEDAAAQVSTGRFTIALPAGFEYRTTTTVTVALSGPSSSNRPSISTSSFCMGATRNSITITPSATAMTFYVCDTSNQASVITLSTIRIRPTASTPLASGNMYLDSTGSGTIVGVTKGAAGTNFGSLAVQPGPTTQLGVSIPASVTAGAAQNVTVTSKDAYGNTTPAYRGAIRFTSTDPAAVLPADYTFTAADNGVHAFPTVALKTAGNRSVTATDKATASISGVGATTVAPAAASSMTLSGISSPLASGASSSATVTVRDAYNNVATGYRGTIQFTSTDGAAVLPGAYTFTAGDAGTHTFTGLVLKTAGNQGVTVADGTLSGTQSPITVQPTGLDHLAVSPGSTSIAAGATRTFTAQGRDANGNNLGDATSGTTFTISPNGSCTANACTATIAGPHTVTATNGTATGTASMTVTPGAPQLTITLTDPTLTANGTATSTVQLDVRDQYGNARIGDPVSITTDGDATISAVQDNGDGTYSATLTASTSAGTQTITATDGDATGSTILTLVPGPASAMTLTLSESTVEADGTATVSATITVADEFGNPRIGDPVSLTSDGDVTISAISDLGFGVYSATVTASSTAGTETLTAVDGDASATAELVELATVSAVSISPASRGQGANGGAFGQSITITGTGFAPGTLADFGPGVTVKFTTFVDATKLIAHVVVGSDAEIGTRTVTMMLPDGRMTECADCFTVTASPQVTSVSPNEIGPGAQRTVTVTGANFTSNIKVTVPASGVAVTSVTVVDENHLSVGLSTAFAAAPGPRDMIITNLGDAGSFTCSGCFLVTPAPIVSELSLDQLGGGAQATVTVTGSNFDDGAKVSFAGTGVAVVTQQRVDDGHIVATLSIAGAATPGARTVSVVNSDGGRGSCASCFTVNAAPTVTSITPSTLSRGTGTQVTITGTNFVPGATVSLSTGVTLTDVTVVDANTITATATVSPTTGTGNRTVLVTNPDLGKGALAAGARVV
jgi:hypothetical protein